MRIVRIGTLPAALGLAVLLAGCGHSDPGPPTLSATCDGSLMLAGVSSMSVASTAAGTTLSFPDPNNAGQTGTLPVQEGHSCVITPVVDTGKGDGDTAHPQRPGH